MRAGIFNNFVKYVSLSTLGIIGVTCYILADTFFIAQGMGTEGITALNLALPMFGLIFAVGILLGVGGATKYTVLRAQGRAEEANRLYTLSMAAGLVLGLVFMVGGMTFAGQIARLLGADAEVFDLTRGYLWLLFCFSVFFIVNQVLSAFVRNDGAPRLAMVANLASSLFNIVFDYIFIFPMGLGMFGAALATGVSPIVSLVILSWHFIKKKNNMRLEWRGLLIRKMGEICGLGASAFVNEVCSGLVIMAFNYAILGLTGNLGVAAYGVVANLAMVVTCLFNGVAQGMQPLVSESYGRGERQDMHRLLKYSLVTSVLIAAVVYLAAWFGTDLLVAAFNSEKDPALARLAKEGLRIYFAGFFFAGINIVLTFYYSASERPLPAFVVSSIRGYAVIIPAILIMTWLGGMTGAWLAYPVAEAIGVAALGVIALWRRRKK